MKVKTDMILKKRLNIGLWKSKAIRFMSHLSPNFSEPCANFGTYHPRYGNHHFCYRPSALACRIWLCVLQVEFQTQRKKLINYISEKASMIVSHDSRNLPLFLLFFPNVHELKSIADHFTFFGMTETMPTGLNSTKALNGINFHSTRNQHAL